MSNMDWEYKVWAYVATAFALVAIAVVVGTAHVSAIQAQNYSSTCTTTYGQTQGK